MEIGLIGGGGALHGIAGAGRSADPGARGAALACPRKGDRVDLTSNGQLAQRALEELCRMISATDSGPSDLQNIQSKLDARYYDRPAVRYELADRLGGLVDFRIG